MYSYVKIFCSKLALRIYGRLKRKLHFINLPVLLCFRNDIKMIGGCLYNESLSWELFNQTSQVHTLQENYVELD